MRLSLLVSAIAAITLGSCQEAPEAEVAVTAGEAAPEPVVAARVSLTTMPPSFRQGRPVPVIAHQDPLSVLHNDDPDLAANKRLLFDMWRHLVDAGREETADLYLDELYIQHNPNAATGREGAKAYFSIQEDLPIDVAVRNPLVAMIAEGDLVVQVLKTEMPNPHRDGETYTSTWFDMFRIENGRIAEHWDAAMKPGTNVVEMGSECTEPAE